MINCIRWLSSIEFGVALILLWWFCVTGVIVCLLLTCPQFHPHGCWQENTEYQTTGAAVHLIGPVHLATIPAVSVLVYLCFCVFVYYCILSNLSTDKLCCLVPPWANWQRLCHFTYLCLQRARLRHFFIFILYPHTSVCKEPDTDFCQCMRNEIFAFFEAERRLQCCHKSNTVCAI